MFLNEKFYFAKVSDEYDMWIIYGATQKIDGDDKHAYNSAFACSPDGDITAYQKMHPKADMKNFYIIGEAVYSADGSHVLGSTCILQWDKF